MHGKNGFIIVNCLKEGHRSNNCTASKCKTCNMKQNSLLHFDKRTDDKLIADNSNSINEQTKQSNESLQVASNSLHAHINMHIILSTAELLIKDNCGKFHKCRAILDSVFLHKLKL